MSFKKKAPAAAPLSPRADLERKYAVSRINLLIVVITSVLNPFTVTFGGFFFLFAPSMPTFLLELVLLEAGMGEVDFSVLLVPFIVGLLLTVPYLLCWIFSKKHVGWMIAALVIFSVDCIYLLYMYELVSVLKDIVFHAWIMYYLITGVINGFKLRNMPKEEPAPVAGTDAEPAFGTFTPADFTDTTAEEVPAASEGESDNA